MTTKYIQRTFAMGRNSTAALREMLQGVDEMFSAVMEYVPTPTDTDPDTVEWPEDYWTNSKWSTTTSTASRIFTRIYQLDDAFKSTHPIYLRVSIHPMRWSATPSSLDVLLFHYTVAHSLNPETGGLTDSSLSASLPSTLSRSPTMNGGFLGVGPTWRGTHFAVGMDSGFVFVPFSTSYTALPPFIGIERARNLDGTARTDAYMILHAFRSSDTTDYGRKYGYPIVTTVQYASRSTHSGGVPVLLPATVSGQQMTATVSLAAGGVGPVFPWTLTAPSVVPWQSKMFVTVPVGDFPSGVFTTRMFGQGQEFLPVYLNPASEPIDINSYVSYGGFGVSLYTGGVLASGCLSVNVTDMESL